MQFRFRDQADVHLDGRLNMCEAVKDKVFDVRGCGAVDRLAIVVHMGDLRNVGGYFGEVEEGTGTDGASIVEHGDEQEKLGLECSR